MNPRIQHLIQHPFEVQLSDVAILQDEIEKYPYFSTLRTLLLFGLKEYDHSSYQEELKKTSIYCPSRVALYHYLQKEKQESTEIISAEIPEEVSVENTEEIVELVENPINSNETETKFEIEEQNEEEITFDENSLEETISENEETLKTKELEEKQVQEVSEMQNTAFTFSEWLNLPKKVETKISEEVTTPTEREIKFQLIDEFIEKSPKITPPSKDNLTNIVVEKPFNSEEYSDLMTETLAQIYTEQKKYDKAIRAYKILMLKYPEKEEYFTEKIEYIEYMKG
jgi:hypothetical protein